jgi:hypothetical protein
MLIEINLLKARNMLSEVFNLRMQEWKKQELENQDKKLFHLTSAMGELDLLIQNLKRA